MNRPLTERDPNNYFGFIELLLIVVFGALLATVPETIIDEGIESTPSLLLIPVLVLFVEAYIMLRTYHVTLHQRYGLNWLGYDLVLVGLYITVVRLLQESATRPELLDDALILAMIVFVLLFLRQLDPFLNTIKGGTKMLEEAELTRNDLVIPMAADFLGIAVCVVLLITNRADRATSEAFNPWAVSAFVLTLAYFAFKYLGRLKIDRRGN